MWTNVIDVAREASVHPRDILMAINGGHIEGMRFLGGGIQVHPEHVTALELPKVEWVPVADWVEGEGLGYREVVKLINDRQLDGVNQGPKRRWVISSESYLPD